MTSKVLAAEAASTTVISERSKIITLLVGMLLNEAVVLFGLWIVSHIDQVTMWAWLFLMTCVVCNAFLQVGGILGLSYVDRFVKVADYVRDAIDNDEEDDDHHQGE